MHFYQHQVEGVAWGKLRNSFLLADDMGLGKSLQTLAVFGMHLWELENAYPGQGKSGSMLVVCPTNLRENWANEIDMFTGYKYMLLEGNPNQRMKQLLKFWSMESPKVLIVNYEQVQPHLPTLNMLDFTIVAADEAHNLKNPDAVRAKAFQGLRSRRKIMLTGTPIENDPSEMWVALDQINPGQWGTFWQFKNEYCVMGGYGGNKVTGVKNTERFRLKLADVMLRRRKDECLDLPEVQYNIRYVTLDPTQKHYYNLIVDEAEEIAGISEEKLGDISNPLTKYLRLKQICATTATLLDSGEDVSPKLDLAADDAEMIAAAGEKIVVFTQFRPVIDAYVRRLEEKFQGSVPIYQLTGDVPKSERFAMVEKWGSEPGAAVIIGTLKVMSEGLNMTQARHGQFLDKHFNPAKNAQAVDRMNRIGASLIHSVQIYEYLVSRSAEMRVEKILKEKKDMADQILNPSATDIMFMEDLRAMLKERIE